MPGLMSMALILLVLFLMLHNCISLKCFQCRESNKEACEKSQIIEDCPNHYEKPICLTLTYSEMINKRETVNTIKKRCSTEKFGCEFHCIDLWKDCKATCCTDDNCNVGYNKNEPKVLIGNKNKRSNPDTSTKSSSTMHLATLLTIHIAVVTSYLL